MRKWYVERKIINWDKYFIKVEVIWILQLQVLSWLVLETNTGKTFIKYSI